MTSVVVERSVRTSRTRSEVTRLETVVTGAALLLSLNAVVPLVFDPNPSVEKVVYDPISQPLWSLIFVFTLVVGARFHREILAAAAANLPVVVVPLLAVLSTVWSGAGSLTLQHAIQFALVTVLGIYIGVRQGIRGLVAITGWVLLIVLVLSVLFALALPTYGLDPQHDYRWRGVFTTKNELGRLMVYGGLIWAVRTVTGEVGRRLGVLVVLGFAVVGVESGSRTALAVAVMLVGASLLAWPFPREVSLVVPLKGLVVTSLALVVVLTYGSKDFLLQLVGADARLTGRTGTWSAVWTAIQDHPWFGYGFEAFWRGIYGPSLEVWQATGYKTPHSHNGFLDLLLDLGLVGLVAFVAAYLIVLPRALEALRVGKGSARMFPFVYLALLVFYNLSESSLVSRRSLEWLLFVAVAAALPLREEERRSDESSPQDGHLPSL